MRSITVIYAVTSAIRSTFHTAILCTPSFLSSHVTSVVTLRDLTGFRSESICGEARGIEQLRSADAENVQEGGN